MSTEYTLISNGDYSLKLLEYSGEASIYLWDEITEAGINIHNNLSAKDLLILSENIKQIASYIGGNLE